MTFDGNELAITIPDMVRYLNNTGGYCLDYDVKVNERTSGNFHSGLCGYFNGNSSDDLRLMNGSSTDNYNIFGSNWALANTNKDQTYWLH